MEIKEFKGNLVPIFSEDSLCFNLDAESAEPYKEIPLDKIKPREDQPRKSFNEEALDELRHSITLHGILQPIIVQIQDGESYQLIAGERRWRAAQLAGLEMIPAIIKKYDNKDKMVVSLIENLQREDLNPIEEAFAIKALIDEHKLTHQQIADYLGKSRPSISNILRLLELQDAIRNMLINGHIEVGHAKVLLTLAPKEQLEIAQLVVTKNLSVRETEKLVKSFLNIEEKPYAKEVYYQDRIEDWVNRLSKQLHSKIAIKANAKGQGRMIIDFSSIDEVDWLVNKIEDNFTEKK